MRIAAAVMVVAACGVPDSPPARPFHPPAPDAINASFIVPVDAEASTAAIDAPASTAAIDAEVDAADAPPPDAAPVVDLGPKLWLRGTTHVHAKPSGDSKTPIPDVIAWYETRGYDFIVLTDHNRASEISDTDTSGSVALRNEKGRMMVLAGIELTYNPTGCIPAGDESGRCRIHVNLLGVTKRFSEKLEWANRHSDERVEKYQAAIDQQKQLGGVIQLNHPNWYWGMTVDVLAEVARRGIPLVEIANSQFVKWNTGDKDHPSTEALWDGVLERGLTMWGVASDDAHSYNVAGKYPAGGGWIVVRAARDPQAILDALAAGQFYSSNGVALERAGVDDGVLVVQVAKRDPGTHTIEFIENGKVVARVRGMRGRRALPETGYVRAVVTRGDGKKAWIQPARR